MEEMRTELKDISRQQQQLVVEQRVQSASFDEHKVQNERDFEHIDQCIHRTESDSRERDDAILQVVSEIRKQFEEVRKQVWLTAGGLVVLLPIINRFVDKFVK